MRLRRACRDNIIYCKFPNAGVRFYLAVLAAMVTGLTGCSALPPKVTAFAPPTQLTATLTDPTDIDLTWRDHATRAAGYFVEYQPEADDKFIIIAALPPNATAYRHPRLLPRTRFVYRIVPFFGPSSNTAEIKIDYAKDGQPPSAPKMTESGSLEASVKRSLHDVKTFTAAAPTNMRVMFMPPNGVTLTWKDHASDADGYLVEIKADWSPDFKVSTFLPPGTTSATSYGFPPGTDFVFRVRAFFYGQPSNAAEQTTGG
jgi:hypothetical protein